MSGYSGTPLAAKLGIKPSSRVALVAAPRGFDALLEPLPEGARVARRLQPPLDMVLVFVTRRAELEARWAALTAAVSPAGAVWVCWPKQSAPTRPATADMTEHAVRDVVLPTGWVDTKVCAVDATWSGLKCVLRLERRPRG